MINLKGSEAPRRDYLCIRALGNILLGMLGQDVRFVLSDLNRDDDCNDTSKPCKEEHPVSSSARRSQESCPKDQERETDHGAVQNDCCQWHEDEVEPTVAAAHDLVIVLFDLAGGGHCPLCRRLGGLDIFHCIVVGVRLDVHRALRFRNVREGVLGC
ncbi:hypothetical protein H310_09470 [Aphanomyces invadans]|uniref:Uncharacterized protein n=1 Tax=Aphanomyces invadans TaxID=157072 RepID=A0A024TVA8_9STRA|nr:hypothetical protein H310_09470 [Aphanomyces invadans]ETV97566.1 hypothetical protein H310_09470 [Aphanomyces invadans]|eukprot:XP_008873775.1 hypothetical protein H310_09470 [Aphanomyces invadans]